MSPTLNNKMDTDSWAKPGDEYFLPCQVHSAMVAIYVPKGESLQEPLIAPLWAGLKNLPPALIQVGGLALSLGERENFAQKLEQSGTQATFLFYPEFRHGFLQFYQDKENFPGGAEPALEQGLSWLRETFSQAE